MIVESKNKGPCEKMQGNKRFSSGMGDLQAGQSHLSLSEIPEWVTEGEEGFHQVPIFNRVHCNPLLIIHSLTQQVCIEYLLHPKDCLDTGVNNEQNR